MFFVRVQAKTRLAPGFRVSYVEEREIITAKATQNVHNAKGRVNQATGCLVRVVEAKDLIDNRFSPMNNAGNNIRKSLLKRQEALNRFKTRKEAFLLAKEQITKDIEEARDIWKNTVDHLPDQEFNY